MGSNGQGQDDGRSMFRTELDGAKMLFSGFNALSGIPGMEMTGAVTGAIGAGFAVPRFTDDIAACLKQDEQQECKPGALVRDGVSVGTAGYSTVKGLGSFLDFTLGGTGGTAPQAAEGLEGFGLFGTGVSTVDALGPLAAAASFGWDVGGGLDRHSKSHVVEDEWHDGMTSDEYRWTEGQRSDSGGLFGHITGGLRAAGAAVTEDGLVLSNDIGAGMVPPGTVDALMDRTHAAEASRRAARPAATPRPGAGQRRMVESTHQLSDASRNELMRLGRGSR